MGTLSGTRRVNVEQLRLSRAPAAEIAAAALNAQRDDDLTQADFVVVAVEPGQGAATEDRIRELLELDPRDTAAQPEPQPE